MPKIIIEVSGGGKGGMQNSVCISDEALTKAKDGEEVSFKGKGTLVEHEGKRFISVTQVDGEDVEDMEGYSEPSHDEMMGMDGEDALANFMKRKEKKGDY